MILCNKISIKRVHIKVPYLNGREHIDQIQAKFIHVSSSHFQQLQQLLHISTTIRL